MLCANRIQCCLTDRNDASTPSSRDRITDFAVEQIQIIDHRASPSHVLQSLHGQMILQLELAHGRGGRVGLSTMCPRCHIRPKKPPPIPLAHTMSGAAACHKDFACDAIFKLEDHNVTVIIWKYRNAELIAIGIDFRNRGFDRPQNQIKWVAAAAQ